MDDNSNKSYYGGGIQQTQQPDEFAKIQEWFSLCVRKWNWFVISLLITIFLATVYILTRQPVYSRQASVLIKENSSSMSSDFGLFSSMGFSKGRSNLYNEMITFKSPTYMIDVVKALHLDMNYTIKGTFHDYVLYGKSLPVNVSLTELNPDDRASLELTLLEGNKIKLANFKKNREDYTAEPALTGKMGTVLNTPIGKVIVNPTEFYKGPSEKTIYIHRSPLDDVAKGYAGRLKTEITTQRASVIDLTINDVSAQRAEDVLNTLFVVYNQKWIDDINEQAVSTSHFIDDELRQIEADLGNVDTDIADFKSQNQVPDLEKAAESSIKRADITGTQLMELSNQLFMAKYIRNQLGDEANRYKLLPANSGIDNQSVANQILAYNEKVTMRNSMVNNSSPDNPLVRDLEQTLAATREAIIASLDNVIATISNRIADLKSFDSQTKSRISSSPLQAKYLLSVERQQKVKEQLYIFLLQKREENQLSKAFTAYNTKLINPPSGSKSPISPIKSMILLTAIVLGILIPMILLFIMSNLDTAVHSRHDVDMLSMPFVGEIPLNYKKHTGLFSFLNKRKEVRKIVVKEKSGNAINEAFRVVRTNIEFILGKSEQCKVMMLTSTFAGSGKTFISANLAKSFGIKGKRVLLIDLDMRKCSLSTFVDKPATGIADYLAGHIDTAEEVMVKNFIHENVDVLPVGSTPPNPTELLFSDQLETMINQMKQNYDYIIIDCPPLDIVADASIINKLCDLTIFVIRSGCFDKKMLPDVERIYQENRYNNMTLILNGTHDNYTGYGYRSYGYGYGYGYHSKK